VLETAFNQAQTVAALAREVARGPVETRRDLAGNERAVVFTL
jgi:methylase of polypeptide subunit release factors